MATLPLNRSQARNVLHGLALLLERLTNQLGAITPGATGENTLKAFYKDKIEEVKKQIETLKTILKDDDSKQV